MQGFITDAFTFNNLGAGTQTGSPPPISYIQESKLVSFFSRANYGSPTSYFLTGVIRRDGSSRLAEGHKWSVFPAVSASWRISQRGFHARRAVLHAGGAASAGDVRATRRFSRTLRSCC